MVNFGIIGFGNIGTRHARHIEQHPSTRLIGVCDNNIARKTLLKNTAVEWYAHYASLLQNDNIEVVNVCTPNYLHAPITIAALQAGKHVVCEKPMALTSTDCLAMIAAARLANKHLFVVKQNRYNPPVVAVKELIDNGTLGNIYQLTINCFWNRNAHYYEQSAWRGSKHKDGGCLFTQCSHFIDIVYYLLGDVRCISGAVHNLGHGNLIEFEDSGAFLLTNDNKTLISFNFSTCTYQQNMEGSITIIAEHGTLKIGGQYLNTIEYQRIKDHVISHLPQGNNCNDYGLYKGSMSNHDKVIQNVVEVLHGQATVATNGENGKKVIEIIEDMYGRAHNAV